MDTTTVVEQIRLYDGKLFHDERVLSLYLNVKSLVWTYLSSGLRDAAEKDSLCQKYSEWSDETSKTVLTACVDLWPRTESDIQACLAVYKDLQVHNSWCGSRSFCGA